LLAVAIRNVAVVDVDVNVAAAVVLIVLVVPPPQLAPKPHIPVVAWWLLGKEVRLEAAPKYWGNLFLF
jgi:hypothetical protein